MAQKKSENIKRENCAQSEENRKDVAIASIISGVNLLIAQASGADLGTAARILYMAKEELVHWTVDMNFHETSKEQYINRHLYESGLLALGEFLARVSAIKDEKLKSEIVRMLGLSLMTPPTVLS